MRRGSDKSKRPAPASTSVVASRVDSSPEKKRKPDGGVVVMDRGKGLPQSRVNASLAASLLAQDKNLAHIFSELDAIAKTLESGTKDAESLHDRLHRTVLCAIKQSILDREIRSLALADELTSLYSRRAFFALAAQQIRVMRRKGQCFLLFFADVNNLKTINDKFGHAEGDRALIRAAKALKRTFRDSDVLARLGGDEFAILALEASAQDRDAILTRLEKHIQDSRAEEPRYELSLSVGVARFDPKHCVSLGELLAKADQAMYENKRAHSKLRFGAHA